MGPRNEQDEDDEDGHRVSASGDISDAVITQGNKNKVRVEIHKTSRRKASSTAAKGCIVVIVQQGAPIIAVGLLLGYFIYYGSQQSSNLTSRMSGEERAVADFVKNANETGAFGSFTGPVPHVRITDYRVVKSDGLVEKPSQLPALLQEKQRLVAEMSNIDERLKARANELKALSSPCPDLRGRLCAKALEDMQRDPELLELINRKKDTDSRVRRVDRDISAETRVLERSLIGRPSPPPGLLVEQSKAVVTEFTIGSEKRTFLVDLKRYVSRGPAGTDVGKWVVEGVAPYKASSGP